jgi:hypothetical protein
MIFERRNPVKRILSVFMVGFIICALVIGIIIKGKASKASNEKPVKNEENGLTLSDMQAVLDTMSMTVGSYKS